MEDAEVGDDNDGDEVEVDDGGGGSSWLGQWMATMDGGSGVGWKRKVDGGEGVERGGSLREMNQGQGCWVDVREGEKKEEQCEFGFFLFSMEIERCTVGICNFE